MHKIAVYGSLLKGLGNHRLLERYGAVLLGEDITEPKYTMVSFGGFPGVISTGNTPIKIEVYNVNADCLSACNSLESFYGENNPANFYNRITITTKYGEAFIYLLNRGNTELPIVSTGDWKNWQKNE